jgi:hypothetical protein
MFRCGAVKEDAGKSFEPKVYRKIVGIFDCVAARSVYDNSAQDDKGVGLCDGAHSSISSLSS